jgi:hypothetical protein
MKIEIDEFEEALDKLKKITRPHHAEYIQITRSVPSYALEDPDCEFWGTRAHNLMNEIKAIIKAEEKGKVMNTIKAIKLRHKGHFFSAEAKQFFNSRIHEKVYPCMKGSLFITSEKFSYHHRREYTMRLCHHDGTIKTIGEFQGYDDRRTAHKAAKHYAEKHES